jgi:iron-sulfur cluster assembly protein
MSILTLTDAAKQQIDTICSENNVYAVTLNMKGGGCAGFEYSWGTYKTQDEIKQDDELFTTDLGNTFVVGAESVMFLLGTQIDYKKDIMGSMFDIVNPNAKSACGCGVSVNFDMDKLSMPA